MAQSDTTSEYERARARVEKKRKFRSAVLAYVVINAFVVGIWAVSGFGYFWQGWILAAWGLGLVLTAWEPFYRHGVTASRRHGVREEEIQRELGKGR